MKRDDGWRMLFSRHFPLTLVPARPEVGRSFAEGAGHLIGDAFTGGLARDDPTYGCPIDVQISGNGGRRSASFLKRCLDVRGMHASEVGNLLQW